MPKHPLAEVFGYPTDNFSAEAVRHREKRLCPFNNKVPSCTTGAIVNVASVAKRSPFRYPGGKTWLVPRIREWLWSVGQRPAEFFEPFVGGGIVSLTVGFEDLADHVTMVELDSQIAAVWQTILGGEGAWLADRIVKFDLNHSPSRPSLRRLDLA